MKTLFKTLLVLICLSTSTNAGLFEDVSSVFSKVGNYSKAEVTGTFADTGTFIEAGDVFQAILAVNRTSDATANTNTDVVTSAPFAAFVLDFTAGTGTASSRTMTAGDFSELTNLTSDALYNAGGQAYLLTSDDTDFNSFSSFADLAATSGDFKVAARYDLASDPTFTTTTVTDPISQNTELSISYDILLNQVAEDASLANYFAAIDGTNEVRILSSTAGNIQATTINPFSTPTNPQALTGFNFITVNAVPEPSSVLVVASLGVLGFGVNRRRRK